MLSPPDDCHSISGEGLLSNDSRTVAGAGALLKRDVHLSFACLASQLVLPPVAIPAVTPRRTNAHDTFLSATSLSSDDSRALSSTPRARSLGGYALQQIPTSTTSGICLVDCCVDRCVHHVRFLAA